MTPINKFRPRWIERCLFRRKYTLQAVALVIASALALYGLWYSITETRSAQQRVEAERQKTMLAERTIQELLATFLQPRKQKRMCLAHTNLSSRSLSFSMI